MLFFGSGVWGPGAGGSGVRWGRGAPGRKAMWWWVKALPRGPCGSAGWAVVAGWGTGDSQPRAARHVTGGAGPASVPPRRVVGPSAVGVGSPATWPPGPARGWWAPAPTRVGWLVVGPRGAPRCRAVPLRPLCCAPLHAVGTRSQWGPRMRVGAGDVGPPRISARGTLDPKSSRGTASLFRCSCRLTQDEDCVLVVQIILQYSCR